MRQDTPTRRRTRTDWRRLIHTLNQRSRAEFDRAERLAAELADIQASRAWRVLAWLRRMRAAITRSPRVAELARVQVSPDSGEFGYRTATPSSSVSIIIPFKDQAALLERCLWRIRQSTHRRWEVILVDHASQEAETHRLLARLDGRRRYQIVPQDGCFNFSRLCNAGARKARGEFLLFLNNDIEVLTPDWLEQMLSVASDPTVGVVGATLLYPDGTIQHAGLVEQSGVWLHEQRGARLEDHAELRQVRSVPAVSAACLLIRRELFEDLRGFDERYPVTHNDVDLCRRVRARGLQVVVTPHARLMHYESLSRGYTRETGVP